MSLIASIWFLVVTLAAGILTGSLLLAYPRRPNPSAFIRFALFTGFVLAAGLLMRPHEDTFTGLDTSCYRLMTAAFSSGRGFHDVDHLLLEMPPEQRRGVLLEFQHWGRDTRDRSFEIPSLATGETRPYFYPSLPLAATGLETVTGIGGDYFVPLLGLLLAVTALYVGAAAGGAYGIAAAGALLIGTPLPAYLLRGYYAEAAGAALVSLVLLSWTPSVRRPTARVLGPFILGLAVCFHPVMIALSLPALIMIMLAPGLSRRHTLLTLTGFIAGLLPLPVMTLLVCQPYGDIFHLQTLLFNLKTNSVHHLLALVICVFTPALGIILFGPERLKHKVHSGLSILMADRRAYAALLLLSCLPLCLPVSFWPGKPLVTRGASEFLDGVRWSYGLVLTAGIAATFSRGAPLVSRALLLLALLLSPLFFYLKGFEQMGLWSQRRLIPLILLLAAALIPALAASLRKLAERRAMLAGLLLAVVAAAALVNPLRWPAPYLVRHEQGARQWVATLSAKFGQQLTFFDYHPFSVPFSLMRQARVAGLSEYGYAALPGLISWLSGRALQEPVIIATAYINPGLEDGLVLRSLAHESLLTRTVRSKTSLPAELAERSFDIDLLAATPITNPSRLQVHKILDDGPLALRGPWGRQSRIESGGKLLPARWSREGSALIGPLPPPGGSVAISVAAAASRDDHGSGQVLVLHPPWEGDGLRLAVSNSLTLASGVLTRPATATGKPAGTGIYHFHAEFPYDPAQAGIRGYENDLGARIHSITITTL